MTSAAVVCVCVLCVFEVLSHRFSLDCVTRTLLIPCLRGFDPLLYLTDRTAGGRPRYRLLTRVISFYSYCNMGLLPTYAHSTLVLNNMSAVCNTRTTMYKWILHLLHLLFIFTFNWNLVHSFESASTTFTYTISFYYCSSSSLAAEINRLCTLAPTHTPQSMIRSVRV